MAIVKCSSCGVSLKVPDTAVGKKVKCRCGEVVSVPAATSAEQGPPAVSSKSTSAKPSSTPNFFDQLTSKDLERRDAPKEVKGDTHQKKSSDALAPYMKSEGKPGRRVVSDSERWDNIDAIYTVFFALAIVDVGWLVYSYFQAAGLDVPIRFLFVTTLISLVPILCKVVAGFGLLLRKTWGWWFAIVVLGLTAGTVFPLIRSLWFLANLAIRSGMDSSIPFSSIARGLYGVLVSCVAIWMMRQLTHPVIMKRFNVGIPPILAWVIGIVGGYCIGLLYSYILYRIMLG
jgi:hypothetical protein